MKLYKFLRLFWVPKCKHKWKVQRKYSLGAMGSVYDYGFTDSNIIISECSKCGEWKSFKV